MDEDMKKLFTETITSAIKTSMAEMNRTIQANIKKSMEALVVKLEEITSKVEVVADQQQIMMGMVQNLSRGDSGNGLISSLPFHETSSMKYSQIYDVDFEKAICSKHNSYLPKLSILDESMLKNDAEVVMEASDVKIQEKTRNEKVTHHVFDGMSDIDFDLQTTDKICVVTCKENDGSMARLYTAIDTKTSMNGGLGDFKDSKASRSDGENESIKFEPNDHQYFSQFVHPLHLSKPIKNLLIKIGSMEAIMGFLRTRIVSRGMDCYVSISLACATSVKLLS